MTFARPWIQIFLAGCVWSEVAMAQTGTGFGGFGSGSGTTGSGGTTGTTGSGTTGGSTTPRQGVSSANQAATDGTTDGTGGTKPDPGSGTGTRPTQPPPTSPPRPGTGTQPPPDPFGFGPLLTPPGPPGPTSPFTPIRPPGATTTFGLEPRNAAPATTTETTETTTTSGARTPEAAAPTYTAPAFYGKPQQNFTVGQGRFARPRYRYTVSAAMGFDDNTQQTPEREDIEDQVVREVIPAQPEVATFVTERVQDGFLPFNQTGGAFRPKFKNVTRKVILRPAVPEQVIETPIPGFEFAERNASVVSRLDGHMDVQWANARELFTMDLRLGAEYYWSRDTDPLDFNGSLAATYLRKLSPRMQFTGNANLSYQSQPDYSQVNVVDTAGSSQSYFVGNLKLDLSYRWAARFSTVTSLTGNTVMYQDDQTGASSYEIGLGNEFRYNQSPRTTWVLETRYTQLKYLDAIEGAINTFFLLAGSDWTMSRRLRTTLRLGEAVRTFEAEGGALSTPYAEVGIIYQPNRRDQFSLNARYGFEQTSRPQDESIVGRFSAVYTRTFSPRFQGSLSGNYVQTSTTTGDIESSSTVYDAALYFRYMFTRRLSMNARYSYTLTKSSTGFNDYDRSRFFLTGEYEF